VNIFTERAKTLYKLHTERDLNAILIVSPENVRYLTGFAHPHDAWAWVDAQGITLLTGPLYENELEGSPLPYRILKTRDWAEALKAIANGRIGFEADALSFAQYRRLQAAWPAELVPLEDPLSPLRIRKSSEEVESIATAARIADQALAEVLPMLKPGTSERDIALALECSMKRLGAEGAAFDIIVASGERGAYPHAEASERRLAEGELVTIDWGATYRGYHSDATRTYALGEPPEPLAQILRAVSEAEAAALEAVRPGIKGSELDALARQVLASYGLEDRFIHALGHGVGLAVHEGPRLGRGDAGVLEPGMVITIEPGVYVPGVGGARVEDLVLVTEEGHRVLTQAPRALAGDLSSRSRP